eukprot:7386326-Prymnesium_polylepis.1
MIARSSSAKLGGPDDIFGDIQEAHVLIFNPGTHEEGVYTMQGRSERANTTYVLAFEHTDDADRFAQQLHADGLVRALSFRPTRQPLPAPPPSPRPPR